MPSGIRITQFPCGSESKIEPKASAQTLSLQAEAFMAKWRTCATGEERRALIAQNRDLAYRIARGN
jgi:hypothetical protein